MSGSRPHVMVFPLPVQGHITPMMHFSQALTARGVMVTFVTIEYRLAHIRRAAAAAAAGEEEGGGLAEEEEQSGRLRLAGLDDGLPADDPRNPVEMGFIRAVENLGGALEELLLSMSRDTSLPPLTCLVSDSYLPWTVDVALKWGIPRALFWPMSLATCCCYISMSKLHAAGVDPFLMRVKRRGEKPAMELLPSGLPAVDPYDLAFNWEMDVEGENENIRWLRGILESQFHRCDEAAWFIANSFQSLESVFIDALCSSSIIPRSKLLLLGPLCDATPGGGTRFRASLWQEQELDCLPWLDTQSDASVLYISFGSVVSRSASDIGNVAAALLACRQPFLWALRLGWDEARRFLSEEFCEFAMGAGKMTTWTPQTKVLAHRAVGGFLSHAGWNSTIESVSRGVPMVAWPCFLDQFTNSWAASCVWGVGVQVMMGDGDGDGARELEKAIRTLMQSEQRLSFREKAAQLQAASREASSPFFDLFVEDMFRRASQRHS